MTRKQEIEALRKEIEEKQDRLQELCDAEATEQHEFSPGDIIRVRKGRYGWGFWKKTRYMYCVISSLHVCTPMIEAYMGVPNVKYYPIKRDGQIIREGGYYLRGCPVTKCVGRLDDWETAEKVDATGFVWEE